MRIVAGKFRGLTLASVGKGDTAAHLRPTTDRVRENIFNVLAGGRFGDPVSNARVLDLFAGTGALGLEALSRGAGYVAFVDDGAKANALIRENIALCRAQDVTQIFRQNAARLSHCQSEPFDLVFVDPPYGKNLGSMALENAASGGWLADGTVVVLEEGSVLAPPAGFQLLDRRRYGDTHVMIMRYEASA